MALERSGCTRGGAGRGRQSSGKYRGSLRPELISELSAEFGSQAVVLAIDAKGNGAGWTVAVRGGRDLTEFDAVAWAIRGAELGAGEIL